MRMNKLEIKDGKNNSIGGGVKKKTPASAVGENYFNLYIVLT